MSDFAEEAASFLLENMIVFVDLTCGAAWSVCWSWLQDETGDVNRFSHSQWVSEQGCNACMMDLLRCLILRQNWPVFYLRTWLFSLTWHSAAWSVCWSWLQDETGDVNRFSHSQWVSEQGCNACMMDLLRCLILRQKRPVFYLRTWLFSLTWHGAAWSVCWSWLQDETGDVNRFSHSQWVSEQGCNACMMDLLRCLILRQKRPVFYLRTWLFSLTWHGAAWSVCWSWLQDETGDVNRFSHSQLVSEQGCNACMMDLLRCLILRKKRPVFYLRTWLFSLTWHGAAWSVCWSWLQDETGDVNRFSHSQWVSEQGCNACMMDLLRCLILRQKWPVFYLTTWLFSLTWHGAAWSVCWSWLQDETGDVNRFSHSQWVSEQGCNACMMDLLRCLILRQKRPVFYLRTWLFSLTWHGAAWSVCWSWLQDETGDVNRFSHSQWVSEQGCNACMMDLLRCLILRQKRPVFYLRTWLFSLTWHGAAWSVCVEVDYRMRLET